MELAHQVITNSIVQLELIKGFSYGNGTIRCDGRLYVGSNGDLRQKILLELHKQGVGAIRVGMLQQKK